MITHTFTGNFCRVLITMVTSILFEGYGFVFGGSKKLSQFVFISRDHFTRSCAILSLFTSDDLSVTQKWRLLSASLCTLPGQYLRQILTNHRFSLVAWLRILKDLKLASHLLHVCLTHFHTSRSSLICKLSQPL